jgi:hypothetical protein
MNTTTGIQSTGPQGLPASSSQPAIVNENDVESFELMMATPNSTSPLDGLESRYISSKERLDAVEKTGDPNQILPAYAEFTQFKKTYVDLYTLMNGAPPKVLPDGQPYVFTDVDLRPSYP